MSEERNVAANLVIMHKDILDLLTNFFFPKRTKSFRQNESLNSVFLEGLQIS